jgi:predicted nucleic-acid-binding protein
VIAVDTNILARALANEENADTATEKQQRQAQSLLASGQRLFVPASVVLELEWVLRACYGQPAKLIADTLADMLQVAHIEVERAATITQALEWMRLGLDFADALHLASSAECSELVTFEARRFARRVKRLRLKPPCRVLSS